MQKTKYSTCFYYSVLFSCSKICEIKFNTFLILKIENYRRELQNIATDHSGDIDYQNFKKIYRECTKEPYNFGTIETGLPASGPLRFRKDLFESL